MRNTLMNFVLALPVFTLVCFGLEHVGVTNFFGQVGLAVLAMTLYDASRYYAAMARNSK